MRTSRLPVFAFLITISTTAAIVACSGDPPKKATAKEEPKGDDDDSSKEQSSQSQSQTTPPPAAVAPPPFDAGLHLPDASLPPPSTLPRPQPTTRYCMQLSQCCGSLPDMVQQLVCGGTAVAANETACGVELAVCQGGGVDTSGIGDFFKGSNPRCSALANCCGRLQSDGYYQDSDDCKQWVQVQDENYCQDELSTYQSYGECY